MEFSDVDFLKSFLVSCVTPAQILGLDPARVPLKESLDALIDNFSEKTLMTVFEELRLDTDVLEVELQRRRGEQVDIPSEVYRAVYPASSKADDSKSISIVKGMNSGNTTLQYQDGLSPRSKVGGEFELSMKASNPNYLPPEFLAELERMKAKDNLVNMCLESSTKMISEQTEKILEKQKAIILGSKEDSTSRNSPRKRIVKDAHESDSPKDNHFVLNIMEGNEEENQTSQLHTNRKIPIKAHLPLTPMFVIEDIPKSVLSKFELQLSARK